MIIITYLDNKEQQEIHEAPSTEDLNKLHSERFSFVFTTKSRVES